jgi:entericidin B
MNTKLVSKIAVLLVAAAATAGCANTIRGVGQDTANAVNATQDAGRTVERSTY